MVIRFGFEFVHILTDTSAFLISCLSDCPAIVPISVLYSYAIAVINSDFSTGQISF